MKLNLPKFILISVVLILSFYLLSDQKKTTSVNPEKPAENFPIVETYHPPTIKPNSSYTIIFVGDSMTAALGPNFDQLRLDLKKYFPDKVFGLFNYGFASTNILSVEDRLKNDSHYLDQTYPAILGRDFDIIVVESFAHNPLSQFPVSEGLKKQNEALDKIVAQLVALKPNSLIVFLATLPPSKTHYALQSRDLSAQVRKQWAEERIAYLENHLAYANKHQIPIVDVYHKSLLSSGEVNLKYINRDDYIHPSVEGIKLISQTIADYLNAILPH